MAELVCGLLRAELEQHAGYCLRANGRERSTQPKDLVAWLALRLHQAEVRPPPPNVEPAAWFKGIIGKQAGHVRRAFRRALELGERLELTGRDSLDAWRRSAQVQCATRVSAALEALGQRRREIAILYWLEGWTAPEIAAALNVDVSTVWTHLKRAKKQLRENLADLDPGM